MSPVDLTFVVGALLLIALALIWWPRRPRSHIDGWWHQQQRQFPMRKWLPGAWADACDQSLKKAKERRHGRTGHH